MSANDREPLPTLRGDRVLLRPILPTDRERLVEILQEPDVARWWGGERAERRADDLVAPEDEAVFGVQVEGLLVGCVLCGEEDDPEYRHASVDIFLAAEFQGLGLGPEAIRLVARYFFDDRGHHRLTIDPALANERAIAAYQKVGFRPVGVMRKYERAADGTWHDNLLLDLLRGELREDR